MKKEKKKYLKILERIMESASDSKGILKQTDQIWDGEPLKKAEIRMRDYYELMSKIDALIKVCVFTLDGEGTYATSSLFSQYSEANTKDRNTSVCIVLELLLTLLPRREMICYDEILTILSEMKNKEV